MKIEASVTIFKNKDYFVFHEIGTKSGFKTQVSIEIYPLKNEEYELGTRVLSALKKSAIGLLGDNDIDYWVAVGYKTFPSFSKKHEMVSILKIDNSYRISCWKKDRGGYIPDKSKEKIELPLNVTAKEIENGIKRAFEEEVAEEPEYDSFETVYDSIVQYKFPDFSEYIDMGDGHTDAYQIYQDFENEKNYLGFMIDSGYESFSEKDIKNKFEQYYGKLLEYTYDEINDEFLKIKVVAKTKEKEIASYLFEDGDNLLEVIYEIDLTESKNRINKVKSDFENLISSIKIAK